MTETIAVHYIPFPNNNNKCHKIRIITNHHNFLSVKFYFKYYFLVINLSLNPWKRSKVTPAEPPPLLVHRNMPKDQAMDFVAAEYNRGLVKERPPKEPADMAARASQLLGDFLDRQKVERHAVPSETRQLLLLLAEGVHLYPEELATVSQYLRSRQDHMQGGATGHPPIHTRARTHTHAHTYVSFFF